MKDRITSRGPDATVISAVRYWAVPAGGNAGSYPPSPKAHGSKDIIVHDLPEQMAPLHSLPIPLPGIFHYPVYFD